MEYFGRRKKRYSNTQFPLRSDSLSKIKRHNFLSRRFGKTTHAEVDLPEPPLKVEEPLVEGLAVLVLVGQRQPGLGPGQGLGQGGREGLAEGPHQPAAAAAASTTAAADVAAAQAVLLGHGAFLARGNADQDHLFHAIL